jgi:hypothetical protein
LDSICPTGPVKVAGVKLEKHDERLAGGAEVPRNCIMQSGECRPDDRKGGPRSTGCRRVNGSAASCMNLLAAAVDRNGSEWFTSRETSLTVSPKGSRQGLGLGDRAQQVCDNRAVDGDFENILQIRCCKGAGLWHRIAKFYRDLRPEAG